MSSAAVCAWSTVFVLTVNQSLCVNLQPDSVLSLGCNRRINPFYMRLHCGEFFEVCYVTGNFRPHVPSAIV